MNTKVIEGWTGPGRCDAQIEPLSLSDDGLHIDLDNRGEFEWWYFDAHLDNGYTLVVFFHASNPNPGLTGKIGIEFILVRPDGHRVQKFIEYPKSEFSAERDWPEVTIGKNTLRVTVQEGQLPTYEIDVHEGELGCHLTYKAETNGWKPGTGLSQFGSLGSFSWIIPFARASVKGTVTDCNETIRVTGIGYHDHNWLDFPFPLIINYWMWGRLYLENFTAAYAYIQCNQKVDNHIVKVLMLAEGEEVILSTGEFDFIQEDFAYNPIAGYSFPQKITIHAPEVMKASLKANKILEAQNMLENFNPFLRMAAKYLLRIKPGYFRLVSDFELEVNRNGKTTKESGTTLHEIVLFKPVEDHAE